MLENVVCEYRRRLLNSYGMPQIAWGKAGEGTWQKVGDACNVCGPDGCDHTHMPTGLEQSLGEMEFARSACSAAQAGDLEKLRRCLERNPAAVYHDGGSGRTGYTPLHYAARSGSTDCVSLLLRSSAPVVARTTGGATPLMRAATAGHAAVCTLLLRAGSEALVFDSDGETPLHKAAAAQQPEAFKVLLKACPDAAEMLNRRGKRPWDLLALDVAAAAGLVAPAPASATPEAVVAESPVSAPMRPSCEETAGYIARSSKSGGRDSV